jgi:hypothetical protein
LAKKGVLGQKERFKSGLTTLLGELEIRNEEKAISSLFLF